VYIVRAEEKNIEKMPMIPNTPLMLQKISDVPIPQRHYYSEKNFVWLLL
jgi:hypothetical protein